MIKNTGIGIPKTIDRLPRIADHKSIAAAFEVFHQSRLGGVDVLIFVDKYGTETPADSLRKGLADRVRPAKGYKHFFDQVGSVPMEPFRTWQLKYKIEWDPKIGDEIMYGNVIHIDQEGDK